MAHPALPPPASRPWLAGAALIWLTLLVAGQGPPGWVAVAAMAVTAVATRHPWIALLVLVAGVLGAPAGRALDPLPSGQIEIEGRVLSAVVDGPYGPWAFVETGQGPALMRLAPGQEVVRGSTIRLAGHAAGDVGSARGVQYRGVIRVDEMVVLEGPSGILRAGEAVRSRVVGQLEPMDEGRALLAGFLIGNTDYVAAVDVQAMRNSGLSHFTAVSGTNVALFLALLFVVAVPLSMGPRRRAIVGLAGLPVYAAATGFEPSVMRASVMAGLALAGRLAGLALEAWQVLALAVGGLILLQPAYTTNAGFQLSVVATAGVLMGSRWPVGRGRVARAMAVTIGAQAAVAPLLILHFGQVPIVSPAVNLVAAPVVSLATLLGTIGVAGIPALIPPAAWNASLVLSLSHAFAGWPKIGALGMVLAAISAFAFSRFRRARGVMALVAAGALVIAGLGTEDPGTNAVVVMDVGQGDAILIAGGEGRFALVDGGPDPVVLLDKLRSYGVRDLDLVIATHLHADHVIGLEGLVGRVGIGMVWADPVHHATPGSDRLFAALEVEGIPVLTPDVGDRAEVGGLVLTVLGPERRYASSNDQSLVVMATGSERTMLLAGDIEEAAQRDIGAVRADVLKVPHHGAATSDPQWLEEVDASLAVVSVGENEFGHPAPWVIELLVDNQAQVVRTDESGDVIVPLG